MHILAYYSSCGPANSEDLEKLLANIRDGRYLRAKDMILKLNKLNLPLKWEHVAGLLAKELLLVECTWLRLWLKQAMLRI